ncbi:MAG: HEAT repeat domain-containing protein [Deltaproteobacteria bacterium]|nr:HEAT repeat domain-containing protein [Deltaproteobacteria bacterium]
MRAFAAASFALLFLGCATTRFGKLKGLEGEIAWAEWQRDALDPAIAKGLGARDAELRRRALLAIARIEDPSGESAAIEALEDDDADVRNMAAFALGQLGTAKAEAALVLASGRRPIPGAFLALGRIGTSSASLALARGAELPDPDTRRAAGIGIGLLAKRNPKIKFSPRPFVALLEDSSKELRFAGAYALSRIGGPDSIEPLARALGDSDPEVRATATRGLALAGAAPTVLDPVANDTDPRVRVEVARALGQLGKVDADAARKRLLGLAERELQRMRSPGALSSGVSTQVVLAAIEAASLDPSDSLLEPIAQALEEQGRFGADSASDRARIACALAFHADAAEGMVRRVTTCGDASILAWRRRELEVRLLAKLGRASELSTLAKNDPDPRIRTAATDSLGELSSAESLSALIELLDHKDPFVAASAAAALEARDESLPERAPLALARALSTVASEDPSLAVQVLSSLTKLGKTAGSAEPTVRSLLDDERATIRRAAARALEAIGFDAPPFRPGNPPPPAPPAHARQRLRLRTHRGEATLEVLGDVAPWTSGSFLALAGDGWFNGKTFHRVVSDFVVQGGCPRGDGYGGPGYGMLDEASPLPFVRGAGGSATAGRDTGGSQWFLMHAYHPHLTGGYTLFLQVVSGQDVIDATGVDDTIEAVWVEGSVP